MFKLLPENIKCVEQTLHGLGWIKPNQHIEGLAPAGEGNMNRTLRAMLSSPFSDGPNIRSLILKQAVPFVAKYPDIPAPIERCQTEAAFYKAISRNSSVAERMPELKGYDPENHLLCFEDLGEAADFTFIYQGTEFSGGHRRELLQWLTQTHALPLFPADWPELSNLAMRQLNHEHIFELPFLPDNGLDLDSITQGLGSLARDLQQDRAMVSAARDLGKLYLAPPDSRAVLLHGDYYPGGWLQAAANPGQSGVRIIDPEFGFFGPREFDLGVFIAHCHFAGVEPQSLRTSLSTYSRVLPFDILLAKAFAGVEIMRRLLGVAQLPLEADIDQKGVWLTRARHWLNEFRGQKSTDGRTAPRNSTTSTAVP